MHSKDICRRLPVTVASLFPQAPARTRTLIPRSLASFYIDTDILVKITTNEVILLFKTAILNRDHRPSLLEPQRCGNWVFPVQVNTIRKKTWSSGLLGKVSLNFHVQELSKQEFGLIFFF
jgi:hypothetical protein